jgi:hypothetical protein
MSRTPCIAVVLEGWEVRSVLVQEWPDSVPLPFVAIVDYEIDGADERDLTPVSVGNTTKLALCRGVIPEVVEDRAKTLSPKAVLTALGAPFD